MTALEELIAPYLPALNGQPSPIDTSQGALMGLLPMLAQMQSQGGGGGGGGGGGAAPAGGSNRWEDLARQLAQRQYGWGPRQFNALDQIATAESGWNPHAVNSSSGAAGIPQMLPSAHPGINVQQFLNDPRAQIEWMLRYISGRYGTPQHALSVREHQGWY